MSEIREDYLPGCGYKIYQDPAEFTFTTDSVFLAHFPHLANKAKALELGCGTGAVSFYLAARGAAEVTGLDVNPRMVELFNRSAEANGIFWQEDAAGGDEGNAETQKDRTISVTGLSASLSKGNTPKVRAVEWDIKEIKGFCPTESFDLVAANPPYRNRNQRLPRKNGGAGGFFCSSVLCAAQPGPFRPGAAAGTVYGIYGAGHQIQPATQKTAVGPCFCR